MFYVNQANGIMWGNLDLKWSRLQDFIVWEWWWIKLNENHSEITKMKEALLESDSHNPETSSKGAFKSTAVLGSNSSFEVCLVISWYFHSHYTGQLGAFLIPSSTRNFILILESDSQYNQWFFYLITYLLYFLITCLLSLLSHHTWFWCIIQLMNLLKVSFFVAFSSPINIHKPHL